MSTAAQQTVHDAQALDLVAAFIRQHLVCDDHQLDILSLWNVYTWCFTSFPATSRTPGNGTPES